jgi:hypothetical protein
MDYGNDPLRSNAGKWPAPRYPGEQFPAGYHEEYYGLGLMGHEAPRHEVVHGGMLPEHYYDHAVASNPIEQFVRKFMTYVKVNQYALQGISKEATKKVPKERRRSRSRGRR